MKTPPAAKTAGGVSRFVHRITSPVEHELLVFKSGQIQALMAAVSGAAPRRRLFVPRE